MRIGAFGELGVLVSVGPGDAPEPEVVVNLLLIIDARL